MHERVVTEIAEELEFERNILRELLKQSPTAVIVTWGRELRFRYISERSLELMPYDREELIGRTVDEVFPNATEAIEEVRTAVFDRGETVEVHDVPLASSGPNAWEGDRYYTFISSRVEGPDGEPAGILNVGYETTADVRARKLLERELATEQRIANQLQVSLMPDRLPDVPGVDLASGFRPAGDGHEIGGDFYDVFRVSENSWMVVVGDVCGKGAEAAAMTGMARHSVRALMRTGLPVGATLERLNAAILDEGDRARFLTMVCGTLEPAPGGSFLVRMVCAGHPPPYLVTGSDVRRLGRPQSLLGVSADVEYELEEHLIDRGDLLVTLTDGVLERRDGHRMLDDHGVIRELVESRGQHPQSVADGLRRAVVDFAPEPHRDDLAVLALRVVGG